MAEAASSSDSEDELGPPPNLLEVKVIEAEDVIAADRGGTSDPYAVSSFNGISKKTAVVKKSLNPQWNETFQWEIGKPAGVLTIDLFDHDMSLLGSLGGPGDFLGEVQIDLSTLQMEGKFDEWLELQPRDGKMDIVSGRIHIYICIASKSKSVEDKTGLESFPWLDRSIYSKPGHVRTTSTIRMYFASTYADFQDEFKELHETVFPKLATLCQTHGYNFVPVVLRYGLDDRLDRMYMNDTRICPIIFREIAECRRISPRANFCGFLGERYGTSFLPISLDKNEFTAICGSLKEDDEDDMAMLALLQGWYRIDDNQAPNRVLLQESFNGISPNAGLGTDQHNEWLRVERIMFEGLYRITEKVLGPNRLWKYKISLFEQELTLGALMPEDAAEHVRCVIRTVSNLRVVNLTAGQFVDILGRRGDSITDKDLKEVRPNMVDVQKQDLNKALKFRIIEKLGDGCLQVLSQWQGRANGTDHLADMSLKVYEMLQKVIMKEMTTYPRRGFLREEVLLHRRSQIQTQKVLKKGLKTGDIPKGDIVSFDGIRDYLNTSSDNTLPPLLVRGQPGSGMTALLSLAAGWCKEKMLPGAVTVHRQCGLTPDSSNGSMMLWSLIKELSLSYNASKNSKLQLDLTIVRACDLPAADFGFGLLGKKDAGTSDPFVKVQVAKHKFQTKKIKKNLNPIWDEHCEMKDLVRTDKMLLTVWDYDLVGKNDLLGQVEIPLAKIELNTPIEKWFAVPMELAPEKPPPVSIFFDVVVVEAKDIQPLSLRMDVDPFVRLILGGDTEHAQQTTHRDDTQEPEFNESFEMMLEDEEDQMLKFSVWDKGDGIEGSPSCEDGLLGEGEFSLADIGLERTHEGWVQLTLKGRDAGSVHFMVTRHQEILEEEEQAVNEGPRVLLKMMLTPMQTNVDKLLDKTHVDIPCMYLPLADKFRETLAFASAAKPMNIILDGLDSIPSSDPISSMRWLPEKLPRYVHIILGFRLVECKALEAMLERDTPARTVKIKLQDPESCRDNLALALTSCSPKRNLTFNQRSVLNSSFGSKTGASGPGQVFEIASIIPSFDSPISAEKDETAFKEIIRARSSYVLGNRIDVFRLWQTMDYIAVSPLGVTEAEIKEYVGGGTHGLLPSICWAEICIVLAPLLRERQIDGHLVTQFKYESYNQMVIATRFRSRGDMDKLRLEMLGYLQKLPDFNSGGKIDVLRLRRIPLLLKAAGHDREMDDFLTDMHVLEMRLASNMIFDVLINLTEHGPGIGGKAGDLMELLEEYGELLHQRPRMLLQIALNMPDHSGVYRQGQFLEMRRRRSHFYALDMAQGDDAKREARMSIQEKVQRRQSIKLAEMGDRDLVLGHPHAIAWRRAMSWIRWLNKPQTRGQCKKILQGHLAGTTGASFICNGLVLLSVSADRTIKAFSPTTGEILKEIGSHSKGVTIMELSADGKWLATGSEDGSVIVWELDAGPPPTAGTMEKMQGTTAQDHAVVSVSEEGGEIAQDRDGTNSELMQQQQVRYPAQYLQIQAFTKRITGIAFTPSDTITVSADENDVKIFEIRGDGRTELDSFIPFRYSVTALAVTPPDSATQMVAVSGRTAVKLYRFETLDFRGGLYGHERAVTDVKFSTGGEIGLLVATVSSDRMLKVWRQMGPRQWTVWCNCEGHSDCIRTVAWAPDGQSIVTGSADNTMKVWALQGEDEDDAEATLSESAELADAMSQTRREKKFKLLCTLDGHGDTVTSVRFHPAGSLALSCSRDRKVRVYDTRVPFRAVEPASHSHSVSVITAAKGKASFPHDKEARELVASVDTAGMVKIWDVQTGEPVHVWTVDSQHSQPVTCMAFTNSVNFLITASKDGSIKRWDLRRLAEDSKQMSEEARKRQEKKEKELEENPRKLKAHQGGVGVLTMHHKGEFFLTAGLQEPKMTIWDAETMLDVQSVETHADATTLQAHFSNDGKFVILADSSNQFRLFNIEGNKQVFSCHIDSTDMMRMIDFASDGNFIATVAQDASEINLWDAAAGLQLKGILRDHSAPVLRTSFSADGRYLVSISQDKTIIVWRVSECVSVASVLIDHLPSALFVGHSWPRLCAADTTGHVYYMQVVHPTPLTVEQDNEVTKVRLSTTRSGKH